MVSRVDEQAVRMLPVNIARQHCTDNHVSRYRLLLRPAL